MKHCHCAPAKIGKALVIIGAINWGLVGIGALMMKDWNIVHMILGGVPTIEAIVYILVGIAGIVLIFGCRCKTCMSCNTCAVDTKGSTDTAPKM